METFDSAGTRWGKLTSLHPAFSNLSLSKAPSVFTISSELVEICANENSSNGCIFQISQEKECFFASYTGSGLSVYIEEQILREGEEVKISSGEKIAFMVKTQQDDIRIEYVFSSELLPDKKSILKRDRETNEEALMLKKQREFYETMEDETKCGVCKRMIYECSSVVPCLHRFCIECLLLHLMDSQTCPQCGWRCVEFRKDTIFNNIIEAYQETGLQSDRSQEECTEIHERLETGRIVARFEYPNGDIYEGEWKKFRRDGKGKRMFKNGDTYEGDWKNDKKEGKGKMIYNDGDIYEGDWKNGKIEGKGKMMYNDGNIYEGDWKNDDREGNGKAMYKSGDIYEGDWKNDKREGKGKYIFINGAIYEGDFKNGEREGNGKMMYKNGNVYEGDWKNDLPDE